MSLIEEVRREAFGLSKNFRYGEKDWGKISVLFLGLSLVSSFGFIARSIPHLQSPPSTATRVITLGSALPTPIPNPQPADGYGQLLSLAGDWEGGWNNSPFRTTGELIASISINPDGTASFTTDLAGLVFGLVNPEPKTFPGTYTSQGITFQAQGDNLFGDMVITISPEGFFRIEAANMPVLGFESVTLEGTITAEGMSGTYTIIFSMGSPADGVFDLTKELRLRFSGI